MARKRASIKGKGEEILGIKPGGKGADILFGGSTEAEPTPDSQAEGTEAAALSGEEGLPEGEADLDELLSVEAEAAEGEAALPGVTEPPVAVEVEGLPQGEADLDEEIDLDNLLSAEAEAAEEETELPDLATTPAAPAPPSEPTAPVPAVELPQPSPYATIRPALEPMAAPPPGVERPAPAPPPSASAPKPARPVVKPSPAPSLPEAASKPPPVVDSRPPPPSPAPAVAPPTTATGAPDLSVPRPPRYIQMVSGDYDLLAEDLSADAVAAALIGAPEGVRLTAEQRAELLRRRSVQGRLSQLDKAIDGQYERILRDNVSVNKSITDWCQNMLAEARTIVMNRQVDKLPKAEWNVQQVRARLDRAEESAKQASRYALPIIIWGAAWFAVFVFLLFNPIFIFELLRIGEGEDPFLVAEVFLSALYFGGIGGVAAVFYHLFKYVSQRSFDNQYVLSFFGKPFMGMILGSMVYLTVFVVMRVLGLAPVGLQPEEAQSVPLLTDVMYLAILYFVAMAAGFKENLAFDLLNRVIKAVLGGDRDEKSAQPPPETAPAS